MRYSALSFLSVCGFSSFLSLLIIQQIDFTRVERYFQLAYHLKIHTFTNTSEERYISVHLVVGNSITVGVVVLLLFLLFVVFVINRQALFE